MNIISPRLLTLSALLGPVLYCGVAYAITPSEANAIVESEPAEPVKLENPARGQIRKCLFNTGDTVTGTLINWSPTQIFINHETLGLLAIERAQLKSAEIYVAPEPVAADLYVINHELSFGLTGSSSKSDVTRQDVNLQYVATHDNHTTRWSLDSLWIYGQRDSITDRNKSTTKAYHDWLIPEQPWFYFARTEIYYDKFKDWEWRTGAYGGMGYSFYQTNDSLITARIGSGHRYELGDNQKSSPDYIFAGTNIKLKLSNSQALVSEILYFPQIEKHNAHRYNLQIEWQVMISDSKRWVLKTGIKNNYTRGDTTPENNGNDFSYYTRIGIRF